MAYKILFLDIDGTIVANDPTALPTERVIRAVKDAQRKVYVAVVTGRPFYLARPVLTSLGLLGLSVFNGGAEIIDVSSGRMLYRQALSVETVRSIVTKVLPFGYNTYLDDDPYGTPIQNPHAVTVDSSQVLIEAVRKADVVALMEQLASVSSVDRQYEYKQSQTTVFSTDSWKSKDAVDIHLVHSLGTKKYGVERLLNILQFAKEESMAIGDGQNDIPMLEVAGFRVVMGNAPVEVKGMADYIAPPLLEDGVAVTIDKFILNDNSPSETHQIEATTPRSKQSGIATPPLAHPML